ncbi:unnamed protein product [Ixodes pacificus]
MRRSLAEELPTPTTTYSFWCTARPQHGRVAGNVPTRSRRQPPGPTSCSPVGWSNEAAHPRKERVTTETSAPESSLNRRGQPWMFTTMYRPGSCNDSLECSWIWLRRFVFKRKHAV